MKTARVLLADDHARACGHSLALEKMSGIEAGGRSRRRVQDVRQHSLRFRTGRPYNLTTELTIAR
jgi:hypothetical protein